MHLAYNPASSVLPCLSAPHKRDKQGRMVLGLICEWDLEGNLCGLDTGHLRLEKIRVTFAGVNERPFSVHFRIGQRTCVAFFPGFLFYLN